MSKAYSSSSTTPVTAPDSAPVTVLWAFADTWIPQGYDIKTLKRNIEVALQKSNPAFFIEEFIAMGPDRGDKYEAILSCPDDFSFLPIQREDFRCEHITTELDLVMRLHMKALEDKEYILLITGEVGEVDLRSIIKGLHDLGLHIMIARLEDSTGELHHNAKAIWLWKSDDANKSTMVNGGAPIPRVSHRRSAVISP